MYELNIVPFVIVDKTCPTKSFKSCGWFLRSIFADNTVLRNPRLATVLKAPFVLSRRFSEELVSKHAPWFLRTVPPSRVSPKVLPKSLPFVSFSAFPLCLSLKVFSLVFFVSLCLSVE